MLKIAATAAASIVVFAVTITLGYPTLTRYIPGPFLIGTAAGVLALFALGVGCVLAWMNATAKTAVAPVTIRDHHATIGQREAA